MRSTPTHCSPRVDSSTGSSVSTDSPCVHCGLCLSACPTYRLLGTEADSPRGRLYIMKAVEEGTLAFDGEARGHLDICLGCLARETVCPSGVQFGLHIEEFRPRIRRHAWPFGWRRLVQAAARSRWLLAIGMHAVRLGDTLGLERQRRRLPGLGLLPRHRPRARSRAASGAASASMLKDASRPSRVALLTGCVADLMRPQITRAAVETLARHGIDAVELPNQICL